MKVSQLLPLLMFGLSTAAFAKALPPTQDITVPNLDIDSPPCVVNVPLLGPQCTEKGCMLLAPAGSSIKSIELRFICLPDSATTGFENPPPEIKVETFRVKNSRVHVSLSDGVSEASNERVRYLNFCMYGKSNYFCGHAIVRRLADRPKVDATRAVKSFLRKIELHDALTIEGH